MTVQNRRTLARMTEEAVFQAKRADTVAGEIKPLAEEVNRVEIHLASLRASLAAKQEEMADASTQAQDLRGLVAEACAANNWPVPEAPAELNLRNTDTFPAVPAEPRSAEQIRAAVDDLAGRPCGVSVMCFEGVCKADPDACEGCEHDCHWLPPAAEKPPAAEDTRPDPAPEKAETSAVRTPRALLTALYVRMQLAERGEGRHVRQRRVFRRRALVEVV